MEGITTVGVVSVPAMATPLQTRMARRRASMAYGPCNETTPATNPDSDAPLDAMNGACAQIASDRVHFVIRQVLMLLWAAR